MEAIWLATGKYSWYAAPQIYPGWVTYPGQWPYHPVGSRSDILIWPLGIITYSHNLRPPTNAQITGLDPTLLPTMPDWSGSALLPAFYRSEMPRASHYAPHHNIAFLRDFVTGGGNRYRVYGPRSIQLLEMRESPGAAKLREEFHRRGCTDVTHFVYSSGQAAWDTLFSPSRWNKTEFQVGGFTATAVNNHDGSATFTITNYAGTHSFFYHVVRNRTGETGPMRTIKQTFRWKEAID
jgi:hypothetical protein